MKWGGWIWLLCLGARSRHSLLLMLACSALAAAAWAQPANDAFADRSVLSGFPVETTGSNAGATTEPGEPREITETGAGSIWWEWTAPISGRVSLSTTGSLIDTVLAVYTGTALTSLTLVESNDDENVLAGIFTSRLTFFAQAGRSYSIAVAGLKTDADKFDSGEIRLSIAPAPAQPAPAWSAVDINGKPIQSSDFAGKVVVLDFWATWCAPCRAEIPIFIDLQNRFAKDGLVVIGVSVDTVGPAAVRAFMNELGMNYPVFFTSSKLERDLGGIPSIPTAFLIDRENNIVKRHIGFGDQAFWEKELAPLLMATPAQPSLNVRPVQGKVTISWPPGLTGFVLESARDLLQPAWGIRSEPVEIVNGQSSVTLPVTASREFFRLRRQ